MSNTFSVHESKEATETALAAGFTLSIPYSRGRTICVRTQDAPVFSPLNGSQPLFALLGYNDIQSLEGRLLTLADATFTDPQQRKAFKDILRRTIWFDWVNHLDQTEAQSAGMPFINE